MDNSASFTDNQSAGKPRLSKKALIALGFGVTIEWFDWTVFALVTAYLGKAFFPPSSNGVYLTLLVFAAGFLVRPLGGYFFGVLTDKIGRKKPMIYCIFLQAIGGLLIGLSPTYSQVGYLASILLILGRCLQGFGYSGEIPSAQTYIAETASPKHRGFWASIMYIFVSIGNITAALFMLLITRILTTAQMNSYGWRLPFLLAAIAGFAGLIARQGLFETEIFRNVVGKKAESFSYIKQAKQNWRKMLLVLGVTAGGTISFYLWSVGSTSMAQNVLGFSYMKALVVGLIGNVVFMIALPILGALSDIIGRKPITVLGTLGMFLTTIPFHYLMMHGYTQLIIAVSVSLFFQACTSAVATAWYAELFPTKFRAAGFSLPYSFAVAIFGGTAPYLNQALSHKGLAFSFYMMFFLFFAVICYALAKESKNKDLNF